MRVGETLNSSFGHCYVKNVVGADKRLANFKISADTIGLDYEVFTGIRGDLYVPFDYDIQPKPSLYPFPSNQYLMGNLFSCMSIHLDAMRHNYPSYVTCDDDTMFYDIDLQELTLPDDWDVIILGQPAWETNIQPIPQDIVYIELTDINHELIAGAHCVAIHRRSYFKLLMSYMKFETHWKIGDGLLHKMAKESKLKLYKLLPDISYQERTLLKPYTIE